MAMDMKVGVLISAGVTGQEQVDKLSDSIKKVGATGEISAGQTAQAFRMLPAQFTDIATQLAGGQNPFLILLQQGGQVKDSFGGFGNMFKQLAGAVTPVGAAITAVVVATMAVGKAFYDATTEVSDFNKAIALTGNSVGLTFEKFDELAKKVAGTTRQSIGASKELIQQIAGSGLFSSAAAQPVAEAVARYSEMSGQAADEIVKKFSGATRNVVGLAGEMNAQIGYLTTKQYDYIKSLESEGKFDEAMVYNARLLSEELKKRQPELSGIESLLNSGKKAWSEWWNAAKDSTGAASKSLSSEISILETSLERLSSTPSGRLNTGLADRYKAEIAAKRAELASLNAEASSQSQITAAEKKAIADKADGTSDRLTSASLQRHALQYKVTADEVIASIQREQFELSGSRSKNIITEQDYLRQSQVLKDRELKAEITLAKEKKGLAASEPANDRVAIAQRSNKVAQIEAEIKALESKRDNAAAQSKNDIGVVDYQKTKAMNEFSRELSQQNSLLVAQGLEVSLTAFEYQQMVQRQQDVYNMSVKTRDMTLLEAEAYRKVAMEGLKAKEIIQGDNNTESRSFLHGAQQAVKTYADEVSNTAKLTEGAFSRAFKASEDALVEFAMTGKLNFKDFASSIIKDLIRIQIQQSSMKMLTGFMSGLFDVKGSVDVGGLFAKGDAFKGGSVTAFADGGVVGSPTNFGMSGGRTGLMGEAGPEAIMPLKRTASGALGIISQSGGGQVNNVTVNVSVSGEQSKSDTQTGSALGGVISKAVQSELLRQKRPGGLLASVA